MNGGMVIQERSCPRCSIHRTVQVGTSKIAFCFNCRLQWSANGSSALRDERALAVTATVPYRFGPTELARLRMYRTS